MGDPTLLIEYRLDQVEAGVEALRQANRARNARESRAIIAGLAFLGSVVTALLSILWGYRSTIFK